jgi:hypothetical protein
MHQPISPAARALLDAGTGPRARRFAHAVVRQVAYPPGHAASGEPDDEEVAAALVRFLRVAERSEEPASRHSPRTSPELLSSIFQNMDLLYTDGYEGADRVSLHLLSVVWQEDGIEGAGSSGTREEN